MSTTREPAPPHLDDERLKTDESLQEERAKVDALLDPEVEQSREAAAVAREEATEALETERERVDDELRKTPRKTVVEAVAAERERADETIAVEREHAKVLERLEHARSAAESEALEHERLRTDRSLVDERDTTDATIVAQAERLQIVSHDLKNPLQAIVTGAALIRKAVVGNGPIDVERVRQSAERIERGARAMDRLIVDLLTSTSLELGSLPLTLARREVAPLVDECVKTLEASAAEKQLRFDFRVEGGGPLWVRCDAGRVSQTLCNVIANAIKFTPPRGTVQLLVARVDDDVHLAVHDSGPGVPEREAPRIFERHFRGTSEPAGLGLGLYIAKTIVDLHGGRIWYEPRKGAPGSVFTVALPLVD